MLHEVLEVLVVVGIIAYVIGRQLLGEPLRGKRLIVLPLIVAVIGATDLGKSATHPHTLDVVFIASGAIIAAVVGVGQGAMLHLENRDGGLWGRMPVKGLWLWAALVASRILLAVGANAAGAHVAASTAPILLILGINRLAQAAVIMTRSMKVGIPLTAEKDGSNVLGRLLPTSPTGPAPARLGVPPHTEVATAANGPAGAVPVAPTPTWQATGHGVANALGAAMADHRERRHQRDRSDRRDTRSRRSR